MSVYRSLDGSMFKDNLVCRTFLPKSADISARPEKAADVVLTALVKASTCFMEYSHDELTTAQDAYAPYYGVLWLRRHHVATTDDILDVCMVANRGRVMFVQVRGIIAQTINKKLDAIQQEQNWAYPLGGFVVCPELKGLSMSYLVPHEVILQGDFNDPNSTVNKVWRKVDSIYYDFDNMKGSLTNNFDVGTLEICSKTIRSFATYSSQVDSRKGKSYIAHIGMYDHGIRMTTDNGLVFCDIILGRLANGFSR